MARAGVASRLPSDPGRAVALVVLAAGLAAVAAVLASQHLFGLLPCKLCLIQRWPYYGAIPLALATVFAPAGPVRRAGLGLLAVVFLVSAALGIHHAGVEWGFWAGPSDCGGGMGAAPADIEEFLRGIEDARVVSCTEAAFRLLGLSFAGWNALLSLPLAALAGWAALRRP